MQNGGLLKVILSCSTRLAKDAARHAAARKIASQQQIATRRALGASRHKAIRCNESDQQTTSRRQSDAENHRLVRKNRQMSKKDYLFSFNSSLYGPLHVQPFVFNHLKAFHSELAQLQQQHCRHCRELWPTREAVAKPFICDRCQKHSDFNPFGIQNDMVRDFSSIPLNIQIHLRELTIIEEILLSPVVSIMSVYKLPTGGNIDTVT